MADIVNDKISRDNVLFGDTSNTIEGGYFHVGDDKFPSMKNMIGSKIEDKPAGPLTPEPPKGPGVSPSPGIVPGP